MVKTIVNDAYLTSLNTEYLELGSYIKELFF